MAYLGVVPVEGGGTQAPRVALELTKLGYRTAFLGDSDRPLNPTRDQMLDQGIAVFLWEDDFAIEQRIVQDLPWPGILDLTRLATDDRGEESVRSSVAHFLGVQPSELPDEIEGWADTPEIREAIAKAAGGNSHKAWFKNIDMGEKLGSIIANHMGSIQESDLFQKISAVREWADQT